MKKKFLSTILALAMVLSLLPVTALAEGEGSPTASGQNFFANGTPITISGEEPKKGTKATFEGFTATGSDAYISWEANGSTTYIGADKKVSIYGGSDGSSAAVTVSSADITMTGGTVWNIYGGNLGKKSKSQDECSTIAGDVTMKFSGNAKVCNLLHGGGAFNTCVKGKVSMIFTDATALNDIENGVWPYINGGVYGNGNEGTRNIESGEMITNAVVNNVEITATNSNLYLVGAGGSGSTKVNSGKVTLNSCTLTSLYLGGINGEIKNSTIEMSKCTVDDFSATNRGFVGTANVDIKSSNITKLNFGAANGCFSTDSGTPDGSGITESSTWKIDSDTTVTTAQLTPLVVRTGDASNPNYSTTYENLTIQKTGNPMSVEVSDFSPVYNDEGNPVVTLNEFTVPQSNTLALSGVAATVKADNTLTNNGTITMDDASSLTVADGATFNKGEGSSLTGGQLDKECVASIDGINYSSFSDAVNDAKSGDTIKILKDITLDSTINVQKTLTFEGVNKADGSKPVISSNKGIFSQGGSAVYSLKNLELEATADGQWYVYHNAGILTIESCEFTVADGVTYTGNVVMSEGNGNTKSLIFKDNTIHVNSRAALVGMGNGSVITGNTIDLVNEKHNNTNSRTSMISLTAIGGDDAKGVIITGNTFKNANRGIAVDNSTLDASKITIEDNTFEQVRFAFELSPNNNSTCGIYDLSRNTYTFAENGETITTLKVQDADDESGDKFSFGEDSTEYLPTETSQVITGISISLDKTSASLYSNTDPKTVQLMATVTTDSTNKTVTWTSDNTGVATVSESGLVTAVGNGTAIITAEAGPAKATCTVTVSTYSTGGGSSSGGSSSSGNKTETVTNPDGSTTTTVTRPNGTVTETTKNPDGSKESVETKPDGTVTTTTTDTEGNKTEKVEETDGTVTTTTTDTEGNQTEVVENTDGTSQTTVDNKDGSGSVTVVDENGKVVSSATLSRAAVETAQQAGEAVALPMPAVPVTDSADEAASVTVSLPEDTTAKVEIPVADVTAGTVAVLVKEDGTEEVIKSTLTTENGVAVTLSGGETVKIVDNTKTFEDVPADHWAADTVAFASSRELFNGTSETTFAPAEDTTRAMVVTVLARYEGVDTDTGDTWFEAGANWAVENGVSDGTNLDEVITREQLATMLWRYAGKPILSTSMSQFADYQDVSLWAADAMSWAVGKGIIQGDDASRVNPQGTASRAEVATILARFVSLTA